MCILNILNVLAYIANVAVTYGIGVAGIAGTATNAELSAKYQTLVTPIGTAFAIWGVIFLAQLVFTVAQLFGPYRQAPLVVKGVGYYYIAACLSQIGWTVAFTFEIIWLSLLFMLAILFFLVSILMSQYKAQETTIIKDYWLLKFPFAIHAGWIIAASFVNLSVVFVKYEIGPIIQYYTAFATIIVVLLIAALALGYPNRPEYVVPLVLSWASVSVYWLPISGDVPQDCHSNNFLSFICSPTFDSAFTSCYHYNRLVFILNWKILKMSLLQHSVRTESRTSSTLPWWHPFPLFFRCCFGLWWIIAQRSVLEEHRQTKTMSTIAKRRVDEQDSLHDLVERNRRHGVPF